MRYRRDRTNGATYFFTVVTLRREPWFANDAAVGQLREAFRAEMARRKAEGNPMHASEMPWGVWGPQGLTWSLHKTGEARFARAEAVFYPTPFPARAEFFKRPALTLRRIGEETLTVHIWGRIKRIAGKRHEGLAPPGSYLGTLLARHGIDPAEYPVREHGRFSYGEEED